MAYVLQNPVVLLCSGVSSSVTGTVVETTLGSVVIKAGIVGATDLILIYPTFSFTNSGNSKTLKVKIGATSISSFNVTTNASNTKIVHTFLRNSLSSQCGFSSASSTGNGGIGNAIATSSISFASDVTLSFTGTLANTGETIALESVLVYTYKLS